MGSSTSYTGNMFSLKLGLFLCIFYIIGMEAGSEPEPEDLHIHLNLQDTTGAAQEAAMDYGHAMWDDRKDSYPGQWNRNDPPLYTKGFEFLGESSRRKMRKGDRKKKRCRKKKCSRKKRDQKGKREQKEKE